VASLDQPVRRRLYELLAQRATWTTRDAAAEALGVGRPVAAFHLDKLAEAGVVEVTFERTTGRTGPGAGRPSKLYRLADDELSASMPDRQYDLAGRILADAVANAAGSGDPVERSLQRSAHEAGRVLGVEARAGDAERAEPAALDDVLDPLVRCGYDPRDADGEIVLSNCPFHRLAEHHRTLVCGMNLDFVDGLVEGLGLHDALEARLAPEPGTCCVRLATR